MTTRQEVADLAGVSPATISNVLNGSKFVSPDLRAKVEAAVAQSHYVPNRAARSLASRLTDQVGILVPSLSNPYFGAVAEGMEKVARQYGYIVSLITAEGPSDQYIARIIERQMDGVFLTDFGFKFAARQLVHMRKHGVRFVLGEGEKYSAESYAGIPCSRVYIDYVVCIRRLFELFKSLGHRRIVFLSGNPIQNHEPRRDEYLRSIAELGLDVDPDLLIPGLPPYNTLAQDGYQDMKALLARRRDFTAVFTLNDMMAIGAMKAVREAGLRVPDDISIAGCDNLFLSEATVPPLTTLDIPKMRIGHLAMEILLSMIQDDECRIVEVQPELVVRESVGRAPSRIGGS